MDVKREKDKDVYVFVTIENRSKVSLTPTFEIMVGNTAVKKFEQKTPVFGGFSKKIDGKITIPKGTVPTDVVIELVNKDCSDPKKSKISIPSAKAHITTENIKELGIY